MDHKKLDHIQIQTSAFDEAPQLEHYASGFPPYHKGNHTTKQIKIGSLHNFKPEKLVTDNFARAIEELIASNKEQLTIDLTNTVSLFEAVALIRALRGYTFIKYQKQLQLKTVVKIKTISDMNLVIATITGDLDEVMISSSIENTTTEELIYFIKKNYLQSLTVDSLAGSSVTEQLTSEKIEMLLKGKL